MDWGILLLVLLVAACPIGMMWMMRGKHGAHGCGMHGDAAHHGATPAADPEERLSELERQQRTGEHEIEELQAARRPRRDLQR